MEKMKNLTTVDDTRLGCLFFSDQRNYAASDILLGRAPRKRNYFLAKILDQGTTSMCTAYSLSHKLSSTPGVIHPIPDSFIRELYCEAQRTDPWEGDECGGSPSYKGTALISAAKVVHKLGFFKEYRWAKTLDEALEVLSYYGPAVLGTKWYYNMSHPDSQGYIHPTGKYEGGHAICAIGIDPANKRIVLANSWGTSWGLKGYCYLSFDDLDKLFQQGAEMVFFLGKKTNKLNQ